MTLLAPPGPLHSLVQLAEEAAAYVLDAQDPLGLRADGRPPEPEVVTEVCVSRRGRVPHAGTPRRRHLGRILVARASLARGFDPQIMFETEAFLSPFPPPDTWVALCGDASDPLLLAWLTTSQQEVAAGAFDHAGLDGLRWIERTDLPARAILGLRRHA